jgi:predicted secreted protein
MNLWTGLAVYFIIWWLVIFMVLPWGVRRIDTEDLGKGEDPGAPEKPRMLMKLLVTTAISGVIFALVYLVIISGVISFRE